MPFVFDDEQTSPPPRFVFDDETAPAKQVEPKRSWRDAVAEFGLDIGKRATGALVGGVASIPLGIEKSVKAGVRGAVTGGADTVMPGSVFMPGVDTDEAVFGPESERQKLARSIAGERAASGVPSIPFSQALSDVGAKARQSIHGSASPATQDAVAKSQISGNLFKGEMDFGKDPSVRGFVMQAADVFGSMLPVVATALITKNPNAGAAVGGSMAAGEGANSAQEFITKKTDAELQAQSPFFAKMIEAGASPAEARKLTVDRASESAAALQGLVASFGDRFTGKLVTGQLDGLIAKMAGKSAVSKVVAGGVLSGAEEGIQEVSEGVASDVGVSSVVPSKEIGEDSAANLVLGALGGGPAGAGRGAYSAWEGRKPAEANPENPAPPAGRAGAFTPNQPLAENNKAQGANNLVVVTPDTSAAEKSLLTPVALTSLDRVNELDTELAPVRQRLAELTPENGYGPMFDQERLDLTAQAATLDQERADLSKDWPKSVSGLASSFTTEAGARVEAQYALMDADDLITSHNIDLRKNPWYPPELQPRERDRAASEVQVAAINQKLDPARLGLSADAANGAPIVGADGLVESGNARTIALKRVYQAGGQKSEDYKQFLRDNATQFGIPPGAIDGMTKPVLVRVRSTPVNRAEFARQANASTVAAMAPSEQAKSDSNRIDSMEDLAPDDSGDFSNAASRPFVRRFMARLPITEQAGMIDANGDLSTTGYARVRNAVLAKAYGDSPVLARMTESMDDNLRNVSKAMMMAAPKVAQMREAVSAGNRFDADITPDLMAAVEELSRLKDDGGSVQDALAQTDLMGDQRTPEASQLLQFLSDNMRRPRRMADFIGAYMDALDAAGDPNQGSLLGETQAPTKQDLLQAAERATSNETTNPGTTTQGATPRAGSQTGQKPGNEAGGSSGVEGNGADAGATAKGGEGQTSQPVSGDWVEFAPDSGAMGIPRAKMPQVKADKRPALYDFLMAKGITHTRSFVKPGALKPTQAEYSPSKAENAKALDGQKAVVLASSDGYILDGHHRWVSRAALGEMVDVIKFSAPMGKLLEAVREFPGATTSSESAQAPVTPEATEPKNESAAPAEGIVEAAPAAAEPKASTEAAPLVTGDAVVWLVNGKRVSGEVVRAADSRGSVTVRTTGAEAGAGVKAGGVFNVPMEKLEALPKTTAKSEAAPEVGSFGPILTQFKGDAQGAIKALTKLQDGEAVAALQHPEVGDVDLVWGVTGTVEKEYEDGYGLAKISVKHPEVLSDLQGFLLRLHKDDTQSGKNRIRLVDEKGTAIVRLQWNGNQKAWLLTAYENDVIPAADGGRTGVPINAEPATPAEQGAGTNRSVSQADQSDKPTDQTKTSAFKAWFGDSKVVDVDGKPLVMYHGTNKSEKGDAFTSFDTYASSYGLMGMGGYFTADPAVASSYTTKGKGDSPTVYPAYLSVKNPIDMDAKANPATWGKHFEDVDQYHEGGDSNESWYRAAEESLSDQSLPKWEGAEIMQDRLRAMGFDGITHIGGGRVESDGVRHQVFIAFDPEQIKSATGNSGDFDSTNPDIRMSRGEGGGMDVGVLETLAARIQARMPNMPKVNVLASPLDAPPALRDYIEQQGAMNDVDGAMHKGQLYLFASGLPDALRAEHVLAEHEAAHFGLRAILGDSLKGAMQSIYNNNATVRQAASELQRRGRLSNAEATEEVIVDIPSSKLVKLTGWRKVVQHARRWLADHGFDAMAAKLSGWLDGTLTDQQRADLMVANLVHAARAYMAGKRGKRVKVRTETMLSGTEEGGSAVLSRSGAAGPPPIDPKDASPLQKAKAKALSLTSPQALDQLMYDFTDKYIDLKRIRDHIKSIGGTITDLNDAYLGEELYHKRLSKRVEDFLSDEVQPLLADLRARGVGAEAFEQFLHARHAPEANKAMAARNPTQAEIDTGKASAEAVVKALEVQLQGAKTRGAATVAIEKSLALAREEGYRWVGAQAFKGPEEERLSLSGMTDAQAQAVMAGLTPTQLKNMEALAARVDAINAKTMDALGQYGLMDQESLGEWRKAYQFYIPLHRDEAHPDSTSHPIGQGFSVKGDAAKRRTGSNAKVTNILGHVAMQREVALTRGEKNTVVKKLYVMAAQNPDAELWSVEGVPTITTVDKKSGFAHTYPDPMYKNKPNVVMVRIAGKDAAIVFNERNQQGVRLAGALKNIDVGDLEGVTKLSAWVVRWFSAVNTQYNPVFGLVNFARDIQAAMLNLSTTPLAGQQAKVAKGVPAALRAVYRVERGKNPSSAEGAKWAALWEDLQQVGGTTGYRDMYSDASDRMTALLKDLQKLDRGQVSQAAHAVVDWLSDYNDAIENGVRLSAYSAALDQGMTRERAASLAKNLTVNFNRKGAKSRGIGAWYAFFNAAIQGNARMFETLRGPVGKKIMFGGVALGMVTSMLGMAVMGGGDGEDDEWEGIPEFVKERAIVIPLGHQDYMAIPLPLGFHVFPNLGRLMAEWAMGGPDKSLGKQAGKVLLAFVNAFNPIGGGTGVVQTVMPTVADPVFALALNEDWNGQPIYRKDSNSMDPTPGFTRAKDSASTPGKKFAELINWISGGNEYRPGAWSPTPDQLDYVVGQLTGGLGRELLKVNQVVTTPFTGDELPAHKVPVLGRIYGNTRGSGAQSGAFYENVRALNEVENEVQGRNKNDDDADAYMASEPLTNLIGDGNSQEKIVSNLRKQRKQELRDEEPGYKDRVKEINTQIEEEMRVLNRAVARVKSGVVAE